MPETWGKWRDGNKLEEKVAFLGHLVRQNQEILGEPRRHPEISQAVSLANPLAESRSESIIHIRLHLAGVPDFRPQIEVRGRDGKYFIDIGASILRVGVEYQGAHHFDCDVRARGAQRMNDLRWAGWTILEVTSTVLSDQAEWKKFLATLNQELEEAYTRRLQRLSGTYLRRASWKLVREDAT